MNTQKTDKLSGKAPEGFWKKFLPGMLMALAFAFFIGLYGPLELYFTNVEEFQFSFGALFPQLVKLFALIFAACLIGFAFCYVLYDRFYELVVVGAALVYFCLLVQGMFFSGSLPTLDGTEIDWSMYRKEYLVSVLLWGLSACGFVLLTRFLKLRRMKKLISAGAVFCTAVLLVTLVTLGVTNDGFRTKSRAMPTKNEEFTMSTDQNLVILVVDAVDSQTFREMMEQNSPQFRETLEDFTYYPNTVCAYPFTKYAIPYILTGIWNENTEDFNTFTTKSMDASPLLQTLREQNYRMGAYETDLVYDSDNIYEFENVKDIDYCFSSVPKLLKEELKLVWFKYAPYPLKPLAHVRMSAFDNLLDPGDGLELYDWNNADFYEDIGQRAIVKVEDKCFRFIHIEGAHVPYCYDKDVNIIDEAEGSYPKNMECTMTIVDRYLNKLKDAGVYDQTAIVLMGDHGFQYNWDDRLEGRCNALLAVKGVGEHHDMLLSEAPISYEDLQEAYQRLLAGKSSQEVFDAREGEDRPRRALLYWHGYEDRLYEYIQHGYASDADAMWCTGNFFPEDNE